MTNDRFVIGDYSDRLYDSNTNEYYQPNHAPDWYGICGLLNELNNEIDTYHQGNILLKKAMDKLSKEFEKIELERDVYESFGNDVLKILRKYEINSLEKLDRVLMEQRVW